MNKTELAEIVGLCFGDGSLTRRKDHNNRLRFQLKGHLTEDREHYDNYIIPLFNKITLELINKKPHIVFHKKKNIYGIEIENEIFGKFLNSLGIPIGIKKELITPTWIKNNKNYLIAFLRGLLDTDGCITCGKDYNYKRKPHIKIIINIVSTSKNLINDVKKALDSLNIKSFNKKPYEPKNKNWKTSYKINIECGINVNKWFKLIGSNNPKHLTKYLVWKKFGFCPPYTTLNQRRQILNNQLNPLELYVGMPEWSNGHVINSSELVCQAKDHVA